MNKIVTIDPFTFQSTFDTLLVSLVLEHFQYYTILTLNYYTDQEK